MFGKSTSVATRLSLVLATAITLLLVGSSFVLSRTLADQLEVKSLQSLKNTNRVIVDMIDAYSGELNAQIRRLGRLFAARYPEHFQLDSDGTLRHGYTPITYQDTTAPDRFTELAGVAATVLTRKGDDFERTSTSITDAAGKRASGVPLGADHPAVPRLLKGESYTGKARMLGRDFMTHYIPIKGADGSIIGAFFVGLDFTEGLAALKKKVLAVKIGETGYPYALDIGRDKGMLTIHPAKEGTSLLDARDTTGKNFVAEMIEKQEGVITYWWQNPGDAEAREKIVVFSHFPEWNWLIASGSYLDEFNGEAKAAGRGMLWLSVGLIPVMALLIWLCTRVWIARPLNAAVALTRQVTGGDFSVTVEARSNDEVGALMRALATMIKDLRAMLDEVRIAATSVATDAHQLTGAADCVAERSAEQSDAASSMAAAVEQMSTSIDVIAEHAGDARAVTDESHAISTQSAHTIEETVQAMTRIAATVRQSSDTIAKLGKESQAISAIADVIKDIADQTNLLALNAAIEAARAGEAGRGFAVVADEVRKLAERTTNSTHEISEMIGRIQQGTRHAVDHMESGVTEVDRGVQLADEAKAAIQRIKDGAQRVAQAVSTISSAISEQSVASASVAQGLEKIAQMTEQNNGSAQETARSAQQLQGVASRLHRNVERFRT